MKALQAQQQTAAKDTEQDKNAPITLDDDDTDKNKKDASAADVAHRRSNDRRYFLISSLIEWNNWKFNWFYDPIAAAKTRTRRATITAAAAATTETSDAAAAIARDATARAAAQCWTIDLAD